MSPTLTQANAAARVDVLSRVSKDELVRLNVFKDASVDAIQALLKECRVRTLRAGDVLVRAGDSCSALYLVLSGCLRAQDPSSTLPDTFVKAGDSVGELFLMSEAVVAWTVSAVEPTRLLAIDAKTAWALVNASHAVARNLLGLLVARSRVGGTVGATDELRTSYRRHATLDEGTGLHNKKWLESMLPRQVTRSAMSSAPLALLMIEIDDFADYGAQFGAAAGDHGRYAVAQTLINSVRPTDLVACYGQAQFAVVLPDADINGAYLVAERLRHAVSEAVVLMSDESILPSLTVAIGAAHLEASIDATLLLKAAEAALQTARKTGGNRVCG